jgi:hypothetical protein
MTKPLWIEFARSSLSPQPKEERPSRRSSLMRKALLISLRSLMFGGKKISLPITGLLSNEEPLSSTY